MTMVNVFGSWIGDFVSPGHEKENNNQANNESAFGGSSSQQQGSNTATGQSESDNNSSETSASINQTSLKSNKAGTVLGNIVLALGSGGNELASNEDSGSGLEGAIDSDIAGKKVVRINLAYLLLVLPVALLLRFVRRRLVVKVPARG